MLKQRQQTSGTLQSASISVVLFRSPVSLVAMLFHFTRAVASFSPYKIRSRDIRDYVKRQIYHTAKNKCHYLLPVTVVHHLFAQIVYCYQYCQTGIHDDIGTLAGSFFGLSHFLLCTERKRLVLVTGKTLSLSGWQESLNCHWIPLPQKVIQRALEKGRQFQLTESTGQLVKTARSQRIQIQVE